MSVAIHNDYYYPKTGYPLILACCVGNRGSVIGGVLAVVMVLLLTHMLTYQFIHQVVLHLFRIICVARRRSSKVKRKEVVFFD